MIPAIKDSTNEKILKAIATLLTDGDTHITRYKIAKVAGVPSQLVYRFFKNIAL